MDKLKIYKENIMLESLYFLKIIYLEEGIVLGSMLGEPQPPGAYDSAGGMNLPGTMNTMNTMNSQMALTNGPTPVLRLFIKSKKSGLAQF